MKRSWRAGAVISFRNLTIVFLEHGSYLFTRDWSPQIFWPLIINIFLCLKKSYCFLKQPSTYILRSFRLPYSHFFTNHYFLFVHQWMAPARNLDYFPSIPFLRVFASDYQFNYFHKWRVNSYDIFQLFLVFLILSFLHPPTSQTVRAPLHRHMPPAHQAICHRQSF